LHYWQILEKKKCPIEHRPAPSSRLKAKSALPCVPILSQRALYISS